jgi:Flp pilus assembly pilin Flp
MVRYLQHLINDSSGFSAIEYALIAALMAVAAIAAICLSRQQP